MLIRKSLFIKIYILPIVSLQSVYVIVKECSVFKSPTVYWSVVIISYTKAFLTCCIYVLIILVLQCRVYNVDASLISFAILIDANLQFR